MIWVKKILKSVVPRSILRRSFLQVNKFKAQTLDKIFFPEDKIPSSLFKVLTEKNPFLELNINLTNFDSTIREKFALWVDPNWSQDEFILEYKKRGYIEPKWGWALTSENKLIYPSLGFSKAPYVHKPGILSTYLKKRRVVKFDKVISLRDTGDENYFHFYNDIISKLYFLLDHQIALEDYTIIVSKRLYDKLFFKYFLNRSEFQKLLWHVQGDDYIEFSEAIFCKPYTHTKKYISRIAAVMSIKSLKGIDGRRLFLTRSPSSLRYIENESDLLPLMKKYGFEIIDTSLMSVSEQIEVFTQCRLLVAIHGAGITNIIFRADHALSLLEIAHPFPYIPFHYIMLCKIFNFRYNVILGKRSQLKSDGGFVVDVYELENKIKALITE